MCDGGRYGRSALHLHGATSQKWTSASKGQLVGGQSGKCLDATGPSSANGTKLQIWTCAASANQLWTIPA
ncbi:RICIN domain-containing protein [Streptomyces sp. NPDC093516]|uniref:RICIN domain-containing protein n=1 Tax=Streptomyces sp. NPDC093516 TaxID=3155304 RepID=UPI003444C5F5